MKRTTFPELDALEKTLRAKLDDVPTIEVQLARVRAVRAKLEEADQLIRAPAATFASAPAPATGGGAVQPERAQKIAEVAKKRASKPTATPAVHRCSKCGREGHNARGCAKAAARDDVDEAEGEPVSDFDEAAKADPGAGKRAAAIAKSLLKPIPTPARKGRQRLKPKLDPAEYLRCCLPLERARAHGGDLKTQPQCGALVFRRKAGQHLWDVHGKVVPAENVEPFFEIAKETAAA